MMSTRTARPARRPVTAADVRVSANLGHLFADRVTVEIALVQGRHWCPVTATASCDLRGGDLRLEGGFDHRDRDGQADPRTLERLLSLAAGRVPEVVRVAVVEAAGKLERKAAEERAEGDEERAAKLERRASALRAAVA